MFLLLSRLWSNVGPFIQRYHIPAFPGSPSAEPLVVTEQDNLVISRYFFQQAQGLKLTGLVDVYQGVVNKQGQLAPP